MAIAYSALSENLKITYGKVNQNAETWDVAFKSEIITPTSSGTSTSGLSCGQATASGLTVNIEDTEMSKPGDKCIWKFTVENKGTIDAEISSIDFTHPTEQECTRTFGNSVDVCGNITYKLLKDNSGSTSSRIKREDLINASSSEEIFLYAEYIDVIVYNNNKELKEYLVQARTGRSKSLSRKQRVEVWKLKEKYEALKQQKLAVDRLELFNMTAKP